MSYIFYIFYYVFSVIFVRNHSVIKLDVIEHKRSFDQFFSQCSISTVFVLISYYYLLIFQWLFELFLFLLFFVKNSCWWCFFCGVLGEVCAIFLIIELTKIWIDFSFFFLFVNSWEFYSHYKYANAFPTHTLKLKSSLKLFNVYE